jgi:RNA polymerase sigma-70 factor (ECF subfamily)
MQLSDYQMTSVAESPSILSRVAAADQTAVKNCIDTFGNLVWALARKYTDSQAEAEKATGEIFLDIWRYAARFDPNRFNEVVFIYLVARWRLIKRSAGIKLDF